MTNGLTTWAQVGLFPLLIVLYYPLGLWTNGPIWIIYNPTVSYSVCSQRNSSISWFYSL